MAKWVPLKEVLMHPEKYGDISERQIDYIPDYRKITLSKKQTGVEIPQMFETEMNHTWYVTLYEGKIYFVTGEVTETRFVLYGKIGYKNGSKVQKEISELYENEELGTKSEIWTEDTVDMAIKTLPEFLRRIKGKYWTAIKYRYKYPYQGYLYNVCHYGLKQIERGSFEIYSGKPSYLYDSKGNDYSHVINVRPLLRIPSNILVDIEEIDGRAPLKLRALADSKGKQTLSKNKTKTS